MSTENSSIYHLPALVEQVVGNLILKPTGVYLDLTVGGGGHAQAIAEALDASACLYGVDRDPAAIDFATGRLASFPQFRSINQSKFSDILATVENFEHATFDGILLDIGLSSRQIDDASRGFAFGQDGPLDMRMDPHLPLSAADLINSYGKHDLAAIIRDFGEERQAARLAGAIVKERHSRMIRTTSQLVDVISQVIPGRYRTKSLARVFQAFRIAVNRELDELRSVLPAAQSLLNPQGRLAVISYHSLEDRIVKRYFQKVSRPDPMSGYDPKAEIPAPPMKVITRRPIRPEPDEVRANPRARSARLRVVEKV
ncbi:MAG: 16S rRNA (cytosine(1402)-N(4))-methyltransferase RsmH [candidate division Zixibacteria bacterium]